MDSPYGKLNLGLESDLNIEAQETKAHGHEKLEHIIFGIVLLQVSNGILLWLFFYLIFISKTFSVRLIISNGFT